MSAIHQFVAGFAKGDAISNEALALRDILRSWGMESEIFCEARRILPELRKTARDVSEYPATANNRDVALLHLSIGSPVNDLFRSLPCRKAILYHNVTPPHYFDLINPTTAQHLRQGLEQVRQLAGVAQVNMAVSRFNATELEHVGYRDVQVLPLILDFDQIKCSPDKGLLRRFGDGKVNILFVGRCAPNKKLEDALKTFFYFQKYVEPNSRFIHVGSFAGAERYYYLLLSQMREMGMSNVVFCGSIPQPQLSACYQSAQVFLCMSEHEGFCIPLIESMEYGVPVLAYAAAAVPETLDGSGVLFHEKDPALLAEMMGEIVRNSPLHDAIVKGQTARVARYRARNLSEELRRHLEPLLQNP